MKKLLSSFTAILLLLALTAVTAAGTATGKRPAPLVGEQTRPVSNFSGVAAAGSFRVIIKIGTTESLRLEGDDEALNKIETIVEDGILKIRIEKKAENQRLNFNRVQVYVTAKALNTLSLSGSGNMRVTDPVKAEALSITVSGSGSLETAAISADQLSAAVSGSGSLTTAGNAQAVKVGVSGSGSFDGKKLTTNVAHVHVSGSGNVSINANETLNGTLSGSGKIHYSGAASVHEVKSGSGRIVKM